MPEPDAHGTPTGRVEEAIRLLETACAADPENWELRAELATAYARADRRPRALRELRALVEHCVAEGFLMEALRHQGRIVELDPTDEDERARLHHLTEEASAFGRRESRAVARERPPTQEIRCRELRMGLFAELSDDEWEELLDDLPVHRRGAREVVVREGDRDSALYLVAAGEVRVVTEAPSGKPVLLCALKAGDVFGEVSLLRGVPRIASVVSHGPCEVIELPRATFLRLSSRHPALRRALEELCARRMADWRRAKGGEE